MTSRYLFLSQSKLNVFVTVYTLYNCYHFNLPDNNKMRIRDSSKWSLSQKIVGVVQQSGER